MKTVMMALGIALIYQAITIWQCRKIKLTIRDLAVGGMICALTMILETIMIPLPTGATITCGAMIPIILLAITYDYRLAMICGWICGVLAVFLLPNWQPVHWAQIFVEHMVCFSCLGYAGIFGGEKRFKVLCGILLAIMIKIFFHVLSGVVFFSQNAWDGWGAWGYSLAYNLSSTIPEGIATIIIMLLLPLKSIKKGLKGIGNR